MTTATTMAMSSRVTQVSLGERGEDLTDDVRHGSHGAVVAADVHVHEATRGRRLVLVELGQRLGNLILSRGGDKILRDVYSENTANAPAGA